MNERFGKIAAAVSRAAGSSVAFVLAVAIVVIWAVTGPAFGYSERWQLLINTGTTISTFLMVFIIQNAQNRNEKVLQLKLDELLRSLKGAKTGYVGLEDVDDATLERLGAAFKQLHERHSDEVTQDPNGTESDPVEPSRRKAG